MPRKKGDKPIKIEKIKGRKHHPDKPFVMESSVEEPSLAEESLSVRYKGLRDNLGGQENTVVRNIFRHLKNGEEVKSNLMESARKELIGEHRYDEKGGSRGRGGTTSYGLADLRAEIEDSKDQRAITTTEYKDLIKSAAALEKILFR